MKTFELKSLSQLILLLSFSSSLFAQTPIPDAGEIFRDDVVPRIDIFIDQDSLNELLKPSNLGSDYHYSTTVIFDNGNVRDTLEKVGFRLRGNTSRGATKKSFKLSMNTYVPGRKYRGVEKLNLNGEHNDPSIIRSKLSWDILREIGIPAPRANHVSVYVNERYFGLYINCLLYTSPSPRDRG